MRVSLASGCELDDLDETEGKATRALFWTTFGQMFDDRNDLDNLWVMD